MTLFHTICNRRPTVHIAPETEVNNALQECLGDVIGLFAAVAIGLALPAAIHGWLI